MNISTALLALFSFVSMNISALAQVKLDGVISEGEWKHGKTVELSNGGTARFFVEDNKLYVALQGEAKGWAHIYLSIGDSLWVRHASAALGQSVYVKGAHWSAVEKFNWQLRDRIYNDDTEKKMSEYFALNGWVANNNNIGDGKTFEFKIDLRHFSSKPIYFACLFATDAKQPHMYPVNLSDGTSAEQLVYGNTPASLQFTPGRWKKIR